MYIYTLYMHICMYKYVQCHYHLHASVWCLLVLSNSLILFDVTSVQSLGCRFELSVSQSVSHVGLHFGNHLLPEHCGLVSLDAVAANEASSCSSSSRSRSCSCSCSCRSSRSRSCSCSCSSSRSRSCSSSRSSSCSSRSRSGNRSR